MVKVFRSDFNSILACLTCYLSKGPLKRDFLDIYLTTFFGARRFKTTSAMKAILFFKIFNIESRFPQCNKKLGKCFFGSEIIESEDVLINCLY